jgi:hypothetical protein
VWKELPREENLTNIRQGGVSGMKLPLKALQNVKGGALLGDDRISHSVGSLVHDASGLIHSDDSQIV